jgi:hypothetical protein
MRNRWITAAAVVLASVVFKASTGSAADVVCLTTYSPTNEFRKTIEIELPDHTYCTLGYIKGEIVRGDAAKIETLLRENSPLLANFAMNSQGGDAIEAQRIGRLFRRHLVHVEAPTIFTASGRPMFVGHDSTTTRIDCDGGTCGCASACFIAWAGGIERKGNVLGLHRPRFDPTYFQSLSPSEAKSLYDRMAGELGTYFAAMDVSRIWFERMMQVSSGDIEWAYVAGGQEIQLPGLTGEYVPAIAEWLKSACGALTPREKAERMQGSQSPRAKDLNARQNEIWRCEGARLIRERAKL